MNTYISPNNNINTNRIIGTINKNKVTQEEVKAMGLSRCNIVCMRKAGNKSINNAKYVGKM
jgi:hypothetical protein